MSTELDRVDERQKARYRVLKNIYDAAGDSITGGCDISVAFAGAASDMDEGHGILEYLDEKGLISDSTAGRNVALSYQGIVEVERSIMHPESPTEYFGPGMVQHFYEAVGVVQNAADNTAKVEQENGGAARALSADQQLVSARQERRFRVLKRIYDKADGNVGTPYSGIRCRRRRVSAKRSGGRSGTTSRSEASSRSVTRARSASPGTGSSAWRSCSATRTPPPPLTGLPGVPNSTSTGRSVPCRTRRAARLTSPRTTPPTRRNCSR